MALSPILTNTQLVKAPHLSQVWLHWHKIRLVSIQVNVSTPTGSTRLDLPAPAGCSRHTHLLNLWDDGAATNPFTKSRTSRTQSCALKPHRAHIKNKNNVCCIIFNMKPQNEWLKQYCEMEPDFKPEIGILVNASSAEKGSSADHRNHNCLLNSWGIISTEQHFSHRAANYYGEV